MYFISPSAVGCFLLLVLEVSVPAIENNPYVIMIFSTHKLSLANDARGATLPSSRLSKARCIVFGVLCFLNTIIL